MESPPPTQRAPFKVGNWTVDPSTCCLINESGEFKLEPRVMRLLECLAEKPGQVFSREQLESIVWANMVVSYDALSSAIIKLRKALGDDTRQPRYIVTVPKHGYRLIAAVTHAAPPAAVADHSGSPAIPPPRVPPDRRRRLQAGLAVFLVVSFMIGVVVYRSGPMSPVTPTASAAHTVVVLPFKNLNRDRSQDYFSDGITDDITTDLSRMAALRVIARHTAIQIAARGMSPADMAKDLNVDYVIEGSVLRAGSRVRVNVQLSSTREQRQIWAQQYDRDQKAIFAIQDEISLQVNKALSMTLIDRPPHSGNNSIQYVQAYDAFLLGQKLFRDRTRDSYEQLVETYRHAIELDPGFARAYGALAVTYTIGYINNWSTLSPAESRDLALSLANKAIEIDAAMPQAYWSLGFVHLFRREHARAISAVQQAIKLSPNYADAYALLGLISNWQGKPERARQYIHQAMQLNPYYSYDYPYNLGFADYLSGDYPQAVSELNESLQRNPNFVMGRLLLAATLERMGRHDDALWEAQMIRSQNPDIDLTLLATLTFPFSEEQHLKQMVNELASAGIPRK